MKPKFGYIAALALITMLGTVALFLSSRSVAAMPPKAAEFPLLSVSANGPTPPTP